MFNFSAGVHGVLSACGGFHGGGGVGMIGGIGVGVGGAMGSAMGSCGGMGGGVGGGVGGVIRARLRAKGVLGPPRSQGGAARDFRSVS